MAVHSAPPQFTTAVSRFKRGYPDADDYNVLVPNPVTPENRPPVDRRTVGLILIAVLIVLYTLIRWGRDIPWSAR